MATFRVYLRRPTTQPPIWDWAQTVVASSSQIALGQAYQSWVESKPSPAPPALSQCQSQVNEVNKALMHAMAVASNPAAQGQAAVSQAIKEKTTQFLSLRLDGEFQVVNYPSGFHYGITYGANAYFNTATLQDIDSLLSVSSNGNLQLQGQSFATFYVQLLQAVSFTFSTADQNRMNAQDMAAQGQIASVLTEFVNAGGTFTNPLPFGGKLQDVINQMNKLYGSVDKIPDTLNALRMAIASYKGIAADSYALRNRQSAATARLQAAIANATAPTAANGGMQTDTNAFSPGYSPAKLPTANQLIGSLATSSNALTVTLNFSSFSSTSTQFNVNGGTSFTIPILDVLDIGISASASYDLSRYTSSSSSLSMELTYPGLTVVGVTPTPLSLDNTTGWFAMDILSDILQNSGNDVTGYKLQGSEFDPSHIFGVGAALARLKTFVISQLPTVKMTFSKSDVSKLNSDFQANASIKLKLFDLFNIGGVSSSYGVQKVDNSSADGSVTVTLGPPLPSGTIPLQSQIAYVLGGVASYPPNNP